MLVLPVNSSDLARNFPISITSEKRFLTRRSFRNSAKYLIQNEIPLCANPDDCRL